MKIIQLNLGKSIIIDDEDYNRVIKYKWFAVWIKSSKNWYVSRNIFKNDKWTAESLHRFIMNAKSGQIVDHKNRNTFDNRKENLRFATKSQNNANRKTSKTYTKYLGVFYREDRNKWRAILRYKTKAHNLGHFNTPEEAALAYNKKAIEIHGEFANLNII